MSDTGSLGAMLKVDSSIIINPTGLFTKYNGAFIENFVKDKEFINTPLYGVNLIPVATKS